MDDYGSMDTVEVASRIRKALRARSGKTWSVTKGRGTVSGWITIAPRNGLDEQQHAEALKELAGLLGKEHVHQQGEDVPASYAYRREYIDRAEGRTPREIAKPYWD